MKMEIQFKKIHCFPPTRSVQRICFTCLTATQPPGRHDDEGTSLLFSSGPPEAAISGFKDLRNRYAAELKDLLPLHVFDYIYIY